MLGILSLNKVGDGILGEMVDEKPKEKNILFDQYNWFNRTYTSTIQKAGDTFFSDLFSFSLISLSENMNALFQGDEYFVTKIRIDKSHDVFFRLSNDSVKNILDSILGKAKKFNLSQLTELEAKIISSFNDFLFNNIFETFLPLQKGKKRKDFDTIHLTMFVKNKNTNLGGKLIISIPKVLLGPTVLKRHEAKFGMGDFSKSKMNVKIKIGTTKFPIKDIKNIEKEDIVIFENSNIQYMTLSYKDYEKEFRIAPNPGIISSEGINGGNNMEDNSLSQNLWDNIQVEMGAEFDKVKISLGELKNIEEGLVVDISSVYDNKISLKVENKTIARGELIIINDRYGVKIDEVYASEKKPEQDFPEEALEETHQAVEEEHLQTDTSDEDFDYSDFELDDQDI